MNKFIYKTFASLFIAATVATSCGDFGDTNIDPESLNAGNVPYSMVFTNAQYTTFGSDWDVWRNGMIYLAQWNQHIAGGDWTWSRGINSYNNGYSAAYWDSVLGGGDRGAVRDIQAVIREWEGDAANEQNYQVARIMRAFLFQRITDLYGDIPYSQAGNPALYPYPAYDKQEDIYADLLKELDEAQAALGTGTAPMGKQDLFYQGDLAKWKLFANSTMLRVAMRLTKVNPTLAAEYAKKAYENGVITNTADNTVIMHAGGSVTNDSAQPYAKVIVELDKGVNFINKTLFDILDGTNDPRIPLIMSVYPTESTSGVDPAVLADADPAVQRGLVGFYSMTESSPYSILLNHPYKIENPDGSVTINPEGYTAEMLSTDSDVYFKKTHSQPNRSTYGDPTGPTFVVTAAQTNLLLAEAAHRGWIAGDAASFYEAGVRAAMAQFESFPSTAAKALRDTYLTDAAVDAYIAANPFNSATALEQINTQYWITCFFDEYETFANVRRSGHPKLEKRTGTDNLANWAGISSSFYDGIVRRFAYPTSELQINSANYLEALGRMGMQTETNFNDSRVWWDAQ